MASFLFVVGFLLSVVSFMVGCSVPRFAPYAAISVIMGLCTIVLSGFVALSKE